MNAIGRSFRDATALSPLLGCDMDALHILPLHVLPLRKEGIAKHKLIKNAHLVGVLEAYSSRESGSEHVPMTSLPEHFGSKNDVGTPDFNMLLKLAALPSYDV